MTGLAVALVLAFGGGYVAAKRYETIKAAEQLGAVASSIGKLLGLNPNAPSSAPTNTGESQQ